MGYRTGQQPAGGYAAAGQRPAGTQVRATGATPGGGPRRRSCSVRRPLHEALTGIRRSSGSVEPGGRGPARARNDPRLSGEPRGGPARHGQRNAGLTLNDVVPDSDCCSVRGRHGCPAVRRAGSCPDTFVRRSPRPNFTLRLFDHEVDSPDVKLLMMVALPTKRPEPRRKPASHLAELATQAATTTPPHRGCD